MSGFITLECKYCGNASRSSFVLRDGEYICKCCGRAYRENATGTEARSVMGFETLKNYDFEAAENIFTDIISEFPDSVDARWGLLLARYGIVFVKGFYTGDIEPIYCFPNYSYSEGAFTEEPEYVEIENLLKNDSERMSLYRKQAEQIEAAFKAFKSDAGKKENDVFICVKISKTTANNPFVKGTTEDYEKACELYEKLRQEGKSVFFSYVTLKNTIDSDMTIWRNLLKSKKMLLIGSRTEYLNSVWVKSEWERWLWLDNAGVDEHRKNLYIYILGGENENLYGKLPAGLRKLHPQIYTEATQSDLINDICHLEKQIKKSEPKPKVEPKPKPEKKPKPKSEPKPQTEPKKETLQKNTKSKEGYIELLNGSREKIPFGGSVNFSGRSDIVKVMLPESVKEVDRSYLSECKNLEEVYLPKTVTRIGVCAFEGCEKLTTVKLSKGMTSISYKAFYNCRNLSSVEIPEGVTTIKECAFCGCDKLSSVKLPESLCEIGQMAFSNCRELKKIDFPKALVSIGNSAFRSSGLRSIRLPRAVLSVGDFAFSYCHQLKKIEICDTIQSIGNGAFDFSTKAKIFYQGDRRKFDCVYKGTNTTYSNIIFQSDIKEKKKTKTVFLNILLMLVAFAVSAGVLMYVPGSLHWVIAIAGGIIVNIVISIISEKTFEVVNILEAIAFIVLNLMSINMGNILLIYGLGLAIGSLLPVIYRYNRLDTSWILVLIDSAMLILAIVGLIFNATTALVFTGIAVGSIIGLIKK